MGWLQKDKWLELMQQWDKLKWLNIVYSLWLCGSLYDRLCVCVCARLTVRHGQMLFGKCSYENKRLGSVRPHQLPSALGQWLENQITCDHKYLSDKWNVVIWGCCCKMTDTGGDCRDPSCQNSGQQEMKNNEKMRISALGGFRKHVSTSIERLHYSLTFYLSIH